MARVGLSSCPPRHLSTADKKGGWHRSPIDVREPVVRDSRGFLFNFLAIANRANRVWGRNQSKQGCRAARQANVPV